MMKRPSEGGTRERGAREEGTGWSAGPDIEEGFFTPSMVGTTLGTDDLYVRRGLFMAV